jgi:hypothetical protein
MFCECLDYKTFIFLVMFCTPPAPTLFSGACHHTLLKSWFGENGAVCAFLAVYVVFGYRIPTFLAVYVNFLAVDPLLAVNFRGS